jgi:transposase
MGAAWFVIRTEGSAMIGDAGCLRANVFDQWLFDLLVPKEHPLRQALELIPWDDFQNDLAPFYSADVGRPSEPPVMMLKLEYLRYRSQLSDRQVISNCKTDLAYRMFLGINHRYKLPDPSSLCNFRGRLGREGFARVFGRLIAIARQHGLVRDRLRLKDASHVIAAVAIPTTLQLVAQVRDKLLAAVEPFDPLRVEGERVNIQLLQETTRGQENEARLLARVTHLREILAWADELPAPADPALSGTWQCLLEQRRLAHKILSDQEHPQAGDKTRSAVDPDVRRNKHGDWYDGYLVDILMDADSELITQINVLPANGEEAADAIELIRREEAAHGNQVEALSIDGAGWNGPVLRELESSGGLGVDVFVPPPAEPTDGLFGPQDFVEDADRQHVICPARKTSSYCAQDPSRHGRYYKFKKSTCQDCPLVARCLKKPAGKFGRAVRKSDYEAEYTRARKKAATAQYAKVRSMHSKVERKLGEVLNRHSGRRARYRGTWKVLIQETMACFVTNVKRIVRLRCAQTAAAGAQG